jgi:hypothetical protein
MLLLLATAAAASRSSAANEVLARVQRRAAIALLDARNRTQLSLFTAKDTDCRSRNNILAYCFRCG